VQLTEHLIKGNNKYHVTNLREKSCNDSNKGIAKSDSSLSKHKFVKTQIQDFYTF